MNKCIICGRKGECHHIIFKSEGGLDIPLNYIYLCDEHHRGKSGPHKNRKVDIQYKLQLQNKLIEIFDKDYYTVDEIVRILEINLRHAKTIKRNLKKYRNGYKRIDIIKYILGGSFYSEYMLDDIYDETWNCFEEELLIMVL